MNILKQLVFSLVCHFGLLWVYCVREWNFPQFLSFCTFSMHWFYTTGIYLSLTALYVHEPSH